MPLLPFLSFSVGSGSSPATPKAYVRKGQASFALGEFEAAGAAFTKAIELGGGDSALELRRWVRKCDAEITLESAPLPLLDKSIASRSPMW